MRTFRSRAVLAWYAAFSIAAVYSMVVVLFVHPAISGQAFFFFRCHEIKDVEQTLAGGISPNAATKTSYLVADYSLKCFDGPWKAMLPWAIIVVVGFSFGVPLFLLWTLCKHRKTIQKIGRQAILDDAAKKEVARVERTSIRRRAATRVNDGLTSLAKQASAVRTRIRALSRSRTSSVTVTVDGGISSADGDVGDRREGGGQTMKNLPRGRAQMVITGIVLLGSIPSRGRGGIPCTRGAAHWNRWHLI